MHVCKFLAYGSLFWLSVAAALLSLSGCLEVETLTEPTHQLAPVNDYIRGFNQACNFLETFEETFGYPYGGDGSIHHFLIEFAIPLIWDQYQKNAGSKLTDQEILNARSASIALATTYDFSRFTLYHYGATDALILSRSEILGLGDPRGVSNGTVPEDRRTG